MHIINAALTIKRSNSSPNLTYVTREIPRAVKKCHKNEVVSVFPNLITVFMYLLILFNVFIYCYNKNFSSKYHRTGQNLQSQFTVC